jgi:hypothetical protein
VFAVDVTLLGVVRVPEFIQVTSLSLLVGISGTHLSFI